MSLVRKRDQTQTLAIGTHVSSRTAAIEGNIRASRASASVLAGGEGSGTGVACCGLQIKIGLGCPSGVVSDGAEVIVIEIEDI